RKCEIPEMMSLGNYFVSGPITAKGVSVAIRSYPKKLQKSRGARRCPSSSPKGSGGLGWACHHGEGCCQGVAMCPDGHRRRSIIRALIVPLEFCLATGVRSLQKKPATGAGDAAKLHKT